jgi:hypothetical protein
MTLVGPALLVSVLCGCTVATDTACDGLGWVEGTAVGTQGDPLPGKTVIASHDAFETIEAKADDDGRFELLLEPGLWSFRLDDLPTPPECDEGLLRPGEDIAVLYCGVHTVEVRLECDDVD